MLFRYYYTRCSSLDKIIIKNNYNFFSILLYRVNQKKGNIGSIPNVRQRYSNLIIDHLWVILRKMSICQSYKTWVVNQGKWSIWQNCRYLVLN